MQQTSLLGQHYWWLPRSSKTMNWEYHSREVWWTRYAADKHNVGLIFISTLLWSWSRRKTFRKMSFSAIYPLYSLLSFSMKIGSRQQYFELDHIILILSRCVKSTASLLCISGADLNFRSSWGETSLILKLAVCCPETQAPLNQPLKFISDKNFDYENCSEVREI